MSELARAIELAALVHRGQRDKAGVDYILHCLAVMDMVRDHGVETMIVAVLHDSFEDHPGTTKARMAFKHLVQQEFGDDIHADIFALSHGSSEPYDEYIERVAQRYRPRIVKIADLTHNMDPRRIPANQIVDKDFQRWDKYRRALIRLERE